MGQKVNPHGLRVGVIKDWDSRWYSEDKFADYLVEDYNIRKFLKKRLYAAGISKIEIQRKAEKVEVVVHTQKPGVVIGKGGTGIETTRKALQKVIGRKEVSLDVQEVKKPDADAQLVAENIAQQLENRVSFRRAVKSCMTRTMKKDNRGNSITGAQGIKACVSGRLGVISEMSAPATKAFSPSPVMMRTRVAVVSKWLTKSSISFRTVELSALSDLGADTFMTVTKSCCSIFKKVYSMSAGIRCPWVSGLG